jgi:MFS family permease
MGTSINWKKVIHGGLLAGLLINVVEFVVNGWILKESWAAGLKSSPYVEQVGMLQMAAFTISGFVVGIFTVWLYAAIRPRYGAGPKTAVCAGAAVWTLGYLLAGVTPMVMHLAPRRLMAIGIAVGLVEVVAAALVGASVYKEDPAS